MATRMGSSGLRKIGASIDKPADQPDALKPVLVVAFLDYAQTRGILVDPAHIHSSKDKARVENQFLTFARAGSTARRSPISPMHAAVPSTGPEKSPEPACTARPGTFRASNLLCTRANEQGKPIRDILPIGRSARSSGGITLQIRWRHGGCKTDTRLWDMRMSSTLVPTRLPWRRCR